MGTTLTGTTPQDTYDSLIKVTDNGPLSGSLKVLTDGLGNNSAISLSTGAASVTGTLAVTAGTNLATSSGSVGVGTSSPATLLQVAGTTSFYNGALSTGAISAGEKETITTGFNLGTGESVAISTISITSSTTWKAILVGGYANNIEGGGLVSPSLEIELDNGSATVAIGGVNVTFSRNASTGKLQAANSSGSGRATFVGTIEVINFPQSLVPTTSKIIRGNVGIGTSTPTGTYGKLTVAGTGITMNADGSGKLEIGRYSAGTPNSYIKLGSTSTSLRFTNAADSSDIVVIENNTTGEKLRVLEGGGITFNGDTAAANALDDYEEGTWTMGISFGGASVGVTYGVNTGTYTKIGRQVTANGLMTLSSKGSSTGAAFITGLPFTIASGNSNYAAVSLRFDSITFTNQFQAYGGVTSTNIELEEITLLGAVSALTNADFANACSIMVSATYFV